MSDERKMELLPFGGDECGNDPNTLLEVVPTERRSCHEGYDIDRCYDEGGMGQTACEQNGRMCQRDGTYLILAKGQTDE